MSVLQRVTYVSVQPCLLVKGVPIVNWTSIVNNRGGMCREISKVKIADDKRLFANITWVQKT